eukprot:2572366-Pleurochrysis_carterae.AAC.1
MLLTECIRVCVAGTHAARVAKQYVWGACLGKPICKLGSSIISQTHQSLSGSRSFASCSSLKKLSPSLKPAGLPPSAASAAATRDARSAAISARIRDRCRNEKNCTSLPQQARPRQVSAECSNEREERAQSMHGRQRRETAVCGWVSGGPLQRDS